MMESRSTRSKATTSGNHFFNWNPPTCSILMITCDNDVDDNIEQLDIDSTDDILLLEATTTIISLLVKISASIMTRDVVNSRGNHTEWLTLQPL